MLPLVFIVIPLKPRDLFDMGEDDEGEMCDHAPHQEQDIDMIFPHDTEALQLAQDDVDDEPITLAELENNPLDADDVNI